MVTRRPRALSRLPRLLAVKPLPREEATPPVTNRCLVGAATGASVRSTEVHGNTAGAWNRRGPGDAPVAATSVDPERVPSRYLPCRNARRRCSAVAYRPPPGRGR